MIMVRRIVVKNNPTDADDESSVARWRLLKKASAQCEPQTVNHKSQTATCKLQPKSSAFWSANGGEAVMVSVALSGKAGDCTQQQRSAE